MVCANKRECRRRKVEPLKTQVPNRFRASTVFDVAYTILDFVNLLLFLFLRLVDVMAALIFFVAF